MCMCEQWRLHCTSQWGGGVGTLEWGWALCGHHIQNDWGEQWICIKFYIKLQHSSTETIWMIQKTTAMGNCWLAASLRQHTHSCITSYAEFFGKTSNHPSDSAPLQPILATLWLLAFPQTKITFQKEEISDHWWDSGKYVGAANGDWVDCVRSQGAYFEGDWGVIFLSTMSLVSSDGSHPAWFQGL